MQHANNARPARNLAVDYYRVSGVVLIVLGHWLAGSVTYHDGQFGRQNPLVDMPWTQWLTWPFQAVPTFFLVAGYAGAVSWTHRHDEEGVPRRSWLQRRLARVLGPTAVYAVLVSAVVVALAACGVAGSVLEYAGWAVAMHLWFLAVYLVVVSLTPIALVAQRRWGLWVPAALAVTVAAVDAARIGAHLPHLSWVNYVLGWGTLYQLGIAWHEGSLAGRRPWLLAGVSAVLLAALIWLRVYPVSMIGVPGQTIDNTTPPTVALLAFGGAQTGIVMAAAPALNRALRAIPPERGLSIANNNIMALYLWHMIPVVIVAIVGYPAGLLPQPPEGSVQWWQARLEWVAVLSAVTAVEMVLLWWARRLFAAPLPLLGVPLPARAAEPVLLAGAALAAYTLSVVAAEGFAPDGRFPWPTALVFAAGVLLAALRPTARPVERPA
ncbi:acyltransferase family protein [Mycobacterium avium]|uniref:acyltransferase family protein n=1 Tax=Mycobacterium avium TaxID=1764 RepID=UPI000CE456FA|nr:acyltransferase [Mycobacterium avium]